MFKNYPHNVIRLRKGKRNNSQVYWIVAILNKKKGTSLDFVERIGFFQYDKELILSINGEKLGNLLNKGYILKKSVKKLLFLSSKF